MIRPSRRALVFAGIAALPACASEDRTDAAITRDSVGVSIVESSRAALPPGSWTLAAQPRVSIGVTEGAPEYLLTQVQSLGFLGDGSIYVAQLRSPPQVRIYDASGTHVRSIGRDGSGPGELSGILWADVLGDTLRVYDFWAARMTYFGLDGSLLREVSVPTLGGRPAVEVVSSPGFAGGDILATANRFVPPDAAIGPGRSTTFALRIAPTGEVVDSFPPLPFVDYERTAERVAMIPFARVSGFLPHDSLLYVTTGDGFSVEVRGPGGTLRRVFRHDGARRAVTGDLIEALREERLAAARDDAQRQRVEQSLREVAFPDALPSYSRALFVDDRGDLWVERYVGPGDAEREWDVFDGTGAFVTTVAVPAAFELVAVQDSRALGTWTDEMDVETVRVYDLTRE